MRIAEGDRDRLVMVQKLLGSGYVDAMWRLRDEELGVVPHSSNGWPLKRTAPLMLATNQPALFLRKASEV